MTNMRLADLSGRVALVIGASRGIGRAVAEALAREGADVIAVARDRAALDTLAVTVRAAGRRCEAIALDVADAGALTSALDTLAGGGLVPTIVVHTAAVVYRHQRLQFLDLADFDQMQAVDVRSAVVAARWALPHMVAAGKGRILFLGSLAARTGVTGGTAYATSKAALEGLARGIALDYSQRGVTANVLAVGFVETERLLGRLGGDPAAREKLLSETATKRFTSPEEVANMVVFLCSDHARGITGTVVEMTEGAHLSTRF